MKQIVRIKKIGPVDVPTPKPHTSGAAGFDLHAAISAPLVLQPGARALVDTGLALAIPEGYEGQVRPRSGLALKHGIALVNSPGTIDSDYRGPLGVIMINLGSEPYAIEPLARIAQLVIAPVVNVGLELVPELDTTERGAGGYGSTGV